MSNIEQECLNYYTNNLLFFEEHFPEIAKKINLFSKAIELDMYQEKLILEYKDDNYFDIKSIKNDIYFYGKDPAKDAIQIKSDFKFDESNSFNNLRRLNPPKKYKEEKDITLSGHQYIFPLYNYSNKYSQDLSKQYKKIEKFIFIGTGLGFHIPKLIEKINAKAYLIIEPNLELFRLSLFVTDYSTIVDDPEDIFFSIAESNSEFDTTFNNFYKKYKLLNHWFKFHCLMEGYHHYFDMIANILDRQDPLKFPYSILLQSAQRNIRRMNENYHFISYDKNILKRYPVCLVAPGPSLEAGGIDWLKKHHEKFIIIALAASLKKLEKYNIKPDIITSVDPHKIIENQFQLNDETIYKDSIFLCSSNTHPDILEKFEKEQTFLYPGIFNIGTPNQHPLGGTSVGEVSYGLSLLLGAQELYLFGTDVAFDPKSGASHSKEHIHYTERELKKTDIKEFQSITTNDIIEVEGNFEDKVYTSRIFYSMINYYNQYTQMLKKEQKIFNTTNGAKLNDIDPIKYEDINIPDAAINKEELHNSLIKQFDQTSKDDFTAFERECADKDIAVIDNCLLNIRKYKKKKFKTYDNFQYDRLTLLIDNGNLTKSLHYNFLAGSINSYQDIADKILFDFFDNHKKIKENKTHINSMNNYWVMPYEKIFKASKELLKEIAGNKKKGRVKTLPFKET